MIDYSFIRFKRTKEEAFDLKESPITQQSYLGQVQLLPQDPEPYIQTTHFNKDFLTVDSTFTCFVVDCQGNETDISQHFIADVGLDANNLYQILFKLAYLPKDYGQRLVYLKLVTSENITFYSNKFKITNQDKKLTSRIDYSMFRDLVFGGSVPEQSGYNSIRLAFYLNDHIDRDEVSTYLMISNGEHINTNTIHSDLIEWIFEGVDYFTHRRLKRTIQKGKCYINNIANQSTDPFEYEGKYDLSNASTTIFITDQDEEDTFFEDNIVIVIGSGWTYLDGEPVTNLNNEQLEFL